MAKRNEQNERMKRDYVFFLEQTEGLDDKSTDKVLAAILKFEHSTKFNPSPSSISSRRRGSRSIWQGQKTDEPSSC